MDVEINSIDYRDVDGEMYVDYDVTFQRQDEGDAKIEISHTQREPQLDGVTDIEKVPLAITVMLLRNKIKPINTKEEMEEIDNELDVLMESVL